MTQGKKKYYAVAVGRKPGIYRQWAGENGAEDQVKGFINARFKSFSTPREAESWLTEVRAGRDPGNKTRPPYRTPDPANGLADALSAGDKEELKQGNIIMFTDGSCLDNPGPGGYGVVVFDQETKRELSAGYRRTTNNRMELMACIAGLKSLASPRKVRLYSDSRYVVKGIGEGWAERWKKNGWLRSANKAAENADLWAQLLDLCRFHQVQCHWVKGHAGHPGNERCDVLANRGALNAGLHQVDTPFETAPYKGLFPGN